MSVTPAPVLLDLRSHRRPDLLAAFVELYLNTFTDPTEREDPSEWPPRLYEELPAPQPRMHVLVALPNANTDANTDADADATSDLLGGIAFEYYRDSRCGLLTYLVTASAHRRRGLARQLVARAIALLHEDAREHGHTLLAVFAETEDPQRVATQGNAMSPRERLVALAHLGARQVDLPYVQPQLAGASAPCRHLLLLAFHPDATQAARIDGNVVRAFLHEFFRALGVQQPGQDADFRAMEKKLDAPVGLLPMERR